MHRFRLICTKIQKNDWVAEACAEYSKKLSAYVNLSTIEIKSGNTSDETRDMLRLLSAGHTKIYCDIAGEPLTSKGLAQLIEQTTLKKGSRFDFVIGGAYGILPEAYSAFDKRISFSAMTMNHKLFRVFLLEQLYRAMTIIHNHPYHH